MSDKTYENTEQRPRTAQRGGESPDGPLQKG